MKITLAMVMSLDGKITRASDPHIYTWTSQEDQRHFSKLIKRHTLIILGSATYLASQHVIKLEAGKLRVVMTHEPEKYQHLRIPGQLEFSAQSPGVVLGALSQRGYTEALLVGGAQVASSFLAANLITEFQLTLEPLVFGSGTPLFDHLINVTQFKLLSCQKLNSQGTLLLKYQV